MDIVVGQTGHRGAPAAYLLQEMVAMGIFSLWHHPWKKKAGGVEDLGKVFYGEDTVPHKWGWCLPAFLSLTLPDMEQRCYPKHMLLCPTPVPHTCAPQLCTDAPAGLPRLLPGGRETQLLLSLCHSSSCPGAVIGQANAWDLVHFKKCLKLEFGGCAGDGSAWHVVAERCSWGCTSIWWYIYILRPILYHKITIIFFSSTNTACMPHSIHIPKNSRRCEVSA